MTDKLRITLGDKPPTAIKRTTPMPPPSEQALAYLKEELEKLQRPPKKPPMPLRGVFMGPLNDPSQRRFVIFETTSP